MRALCGESLALREEGPFLENEGGSLLLVKGQTWRARKCERATFVQESRKGALPTPLSEKCCFFFVSLKKQSARPGAFSGGKQSSRSDTQSFAASPLASESSLFVASPPQNSSRVLFAATPVAGARQLARGDGSSGSLLSSIGTGILAGPHPSLHILNVAASFLRRFAKKYI